MCAYYRYTLSIHYYRCAIDSKTQQPPPIIAAHTLLQLSYTRQDKFTRGASPSPPPPSSSSCSPCPLFWLFDSLALSWPWLTHFQRLSVRSARVSYLLFHFHFLFFCFFLVFFGFFVAVKGIPCLELHERANHIKCRR